MLLDLNELGKKEKFVGLGAFELSDDGHALAYALDTTGFRQFNLRFKNLQTGAVSPESIARVTSVAWARDGKTVFYVTEPEFVAIPVGVLADPGFFEPTVSVWESRRHVWVSLPTDAERHG